MEPFTGMVEWLGENPIYWVWCPLIFASGFLTKFTDDIFDLRTLSHWLPKRGEKAVAIATGVPAGLLAVIFLFYQWGFILWGGQIFSAPLRNKLDNPAWWVVFISVVIAFATGFILLDPFVIDIVVVAIFFYVLGIIYLGTVLHDLYDPVGEHSKAYRRGKGAEGARSARANTEPSEDADRSLRPKKAGEGGGKGKKARGRNKAEKRTDIEKKVRRIKKNPLLDLLLTQRHIWWVMCLWIPLVWPEYIGFHHLLLVILLLEGYALAAWSSPRITKRWPPRTTTPLIGFGREKKQKKKDYEEW